MAGLSSQLGNRYCYYVGAYLKISKFTFFESKELFLRDHDIMVDSIELSHENSTFDNKLSLDLLATTVNSEYWGECKWSGSPRNITINSLEFGNALLEFMALERYRSKSNWKHIEYLFITSHFLEKLNIEVNNLRTSSTDDIRHFIEKLKKKALKKWASIDIEKINETILRNALNRIIMIRISSDTLEEVKTQPEFQSALNKIKYKNLEREISIPFLTELERKSIILMYDDKDDDYNDITLLGFQFRLSKKILNEIIFYLQDFGGIDSIVKLDESTFPFLSSFILSSPLEFSFLLRQLLNESLNIIVSEHNKNNNIIIVNYDIRIIYIINVNWLLEISSQHITISNSYKIDDITNAIKINISKKIVELSIIEAKRQRGIIIDRDLFED